MPYVSIIVPCYNEQATIALLLDAIYKQSYPRTGLEVIIADGLSTDQTRLEVYHFAETHPDLEIRIVDNPQRIIPSGLNRAIEAAHGQILVRLDAHCMPYPDYIANCLRSLESGLGTNVGGVWEIQPGGHSALARGIATAASHPLGVGDAYYRHATQAQAVDTVPFGAFRRALIDRIGLFDETLLTNEDYEFNVRVRQSGGTVWLDPSIRSVYFARGSLRELARQYWRYGYWKARMLQRYPQTIRWRQALPPVFVASLLFFVILIPWLVITRWLLLGEVFVYNLVLMAAGARLALQKRDPALLLGLPLAIGTMHLTWGAGFLWSLLKLLLSGKIL